MSSLLNTLVTRIVNSPGTFLDLTDADCNSVFNSLLAGELHLPVTGNGTFYLQTTGGSLATLQGLFQQGLTYTYQQYHLPNYFVLFLNGNVLTVNWQVSAPGV